VIFASNRRIAVWAAVVLAGSFFLMTSFRQGWLEVQSDFPNYYTAAVLTRHHMPLQRFYDWRWFQRQMNYTGTERQLGGYIPQTPLTMVPLLPLSGFAPQTAKQVWLAFNLILLGGSVALLARMTQSPAGVILLITLAGYASLASNFLLGQYYIFLLFLLTVGAWSLIRGNAFTGGILMGVICMLKLYSAPFLLYFAWKRQWKALLGMVTACVGLGALSVALFGWDANVFYVTYVFRRASENSILDPYNPGTGTLTNLLRRTFILEPELNPHPLFQAPFAFFLLRPLLTLGILAAPLLAVPRDAIITRNEVAWYTIAILLASPNTASYVFVVLLLPIAILLETAGRRWALLLVVTYIIVCLPLKPAWSWLFPKVWLLFILYFVAGRGYWRNLSIGPASVAILIILAISLSDAFSHQSDYNREPARVFEPVESHAPSVYASSPALSRTGIAFESIGSGGYILNRKLVFDGHAFHPSVPASGSPIFFELVSGRHSRIVSFDPETKILERLTPAAADARSPTISPDGDKLAYVSDGKLFIRGEGALLTPGPVEDAAWFPRGNHLAFSAGGLIYDSEGMRRLISFVPGDHSEPAISPDGEWLAFTSTRKGVRHIWIENIASQAALELTGGSCNSYAPAWELDSKGLVFASDCSRGLGLPRLYRARLQVQLFPVP
jgi:hypothetical protein